MALDYVPINGYVTDPQPDYPKFPQKFITNLVDSIRWSRLQIMPGIQKRLDIWRQIVGLHYGSGGAKERVLMPFLRMQASILGRHLVSRAPRVLVETRSPSLRGQAWHLQEWFAQKSDSLDLETTFYTWALEAIIYPVALIKVCSGVSYDNEGPDMGFPYLDNIDPERAVWDMAAKSWKQLDYIGHFYTVAKSDLTSSRSPYDKSIVRHLASGPYLQTNEMGYEKTETLAQDTGYNFNRLREYIDCLDVYLPKEGICLHLPVQNNIIMDKVILAEPYVGPQGPDKMGSYHGLSYDKFPGSLMASPPAHAIYDMHQAINQIARKAFRQSGRQKTNLLVQSTLAQDAEKVKKAGDGDIIPVSHPEAFKETRLGGPDQQNFAFLLNLTQQISKFGGNFDVLGGLSTDAGTLGQEKMLNQNSASLVQFMQNEVYKRTSQVCRSMLWYEWNSRRVMEVEQRIPGDGRAVRSQMGPDRRGIEDFFRLNFTVHPFSMAPVSPQARIGQWMSIFQGVILPALPMLAQQGHNFDVVAFARKIADYQGLVDLDDVLKVNQVDPMQNPLAQPMGQMGQPRRPGVGEYIRRNVSENPEEAQNQEAMSLMKAGSQNGQGQ